MQGNAYADVDMYGYPRTPRHSSAGAAPMHAFVMTDPMASRIGRSLRGQVPGRAALMAPESDLPRPPAELGDEPGRAATVETGARRHVHGRAYPKTAARGKRYLPAFPFSSRARLSATSGGTS